MQALVTDLGFDVLFKGTNFTRLLGGMWVTLKISLISVALSIVLGILLGVVMTFKNPVTKAICRVYLEIVRIMPQLVLLFIVYYGSARLIGLKFEPEFASEGAGALIFPGGLPGSKYLAEKKELIAAMVRHAGEGGLVASICAAPGLVTSQLPGQEGRRFTCYPGCEDIPVSKGAVCTGASVEQDGNLITGRGPGLAMEFGLAVLARLAGEAAADGVRKGLLL